jgi:outer membrane protein TolC
MKKNILIILITFFSIFLNAELSIQDAIEMALQNNKQLMMAKEDIKIADNNYNDIRGQLFPQINFIANFKISQNWLPKSATKLKSVSDLLDATPSDNEKTLAGIFDRQLPGEILKEQSLIGMIQLQQLLFSGGKLINGLKVLDKVKSIQEKKYEIELQNTIITVIDAYYNLYLAQESLTIQQQAMDNALLHYSRVENSYKQGIVSEYDKLRAELEVARLAPEVLNFENLKNLAEENFKRITGIKENQELYTAVDFNTSLFTNFSITLENAIQQAQENRTELYLSGVMKDIYEVQVKAERGNYLPNVVLQADITEYNNNKKHFNINSDDYGTIGSVGIALQMPLFTGLSNNSKYLRSKHELRRSEYDDQNINELIMLEVRQNWQSYYQSLKYLQTSQQNLELSERALNIAQARFENKSGIQLEVFDAQIQFNAAKIALSQAKIKIIKDYFNLNKSIGNKLINIIGEKKKKKYYL